MRSFLLSICAVALLGAGFCGAPRADAAALVPQSLDLPALRYATMAWAVPDTSSASSGKSILAMSGLAPDGVIRTYVLWIEPVLGHPAVVKRDSTSIPGVVFGQMDWADYDRDGDLDLAISGRTESVEDTLAGAITAVYRQMPDGTFERAPHFPDPSEAPGLDSSIVRWVDYDVDGYVDLFISGRKRTLSVSGGVRSISGESRLYVLRNTTPDGWTHEFTVDNGVESRVDQIVPVHGGAMDWGDMNGDGTPDLAITGQNVSPLQGGRALRDTLTEVYINSPPGVLTRNILTALTARCGGGIAWGDFNRNGLLDLAISGYAKNSEGGALALAIYANLGEGNFKRESIQLDQRYAVAGRLVWGDVDNDTWPDLVSMGDATSEPAGVRYYRNNGDNTFSLLTLDAPLPPLSQGTFVIGHLDDDGTLDLVTTGYNSSPVPMRSGQVSLSTSTSKAEARAWIMSGMPPNAIPTPPTRCDALVTGDKIIFSWDEGHDAEDDPLLSYEVLMYLGEGGLKVFSSRARFGRGPQGRRLSFTINRSLAPHPGMPLYIRSVDDSWATSAWSQPKLVRVQDYVNSLENVVPVDRAAATWVDVNNDGTPDLVVNGRDQGQNQTNRLYLTSNKHLVPNTEYSLPGLELGGQAWGDIDGDGDLDVLVTGSESAGSRITKLFRNLSEEAPGRFSTGAFVFQGLTGSRAAMGDIDNDGDMDVVITGLAQLAGGQQVFKTYLALNTGVLEGQEAEFDTLSLNLRPTGQDQGVTDGWVSLYDYDQDGDLDIILQGTTSAASQWPDAGGIFEIYRNDGNLHFTPAYTWTGPRTPPVASLPPGDSRLDQLDLGEHAWADIDDDGDPDLIIVGYSNVTSEFMLRPSSFDNGTLRIYENRGGGVLSLKQSFSGLYLASLAVADVDNDGDPDILVSGFDDHAENPILKEGQPTVRLYRNLGGTFALEQITLFDKYGSGAGATRLADMDGDGDLDAVIIGRSSSPAGKAVPLSTVLNNTNSSSFVNQRPSSPGGLTAYVGTADSVRLAWAEATDPNGAMHQTYALRVGTKPGGNEVRPGGEPVGPGGLGYVTQARLRRLPDGVYYWSVRAVDNGLARSDWAPEQTFIIDTTPPRVVRLRGDTLSVGLDQVINVAIGFKDSLVGVDQSVLGMRVMLSTLGRPAIEVAPDGWDPGDVWMGRVEVPPGSFLSEPVTVSISGVRDKRGNLMPDTSITTRLMSATATRITREEGGRVANSAGTIGLYVPPNGFAQDVRLSLSEPDPVQLPAGPGASVVMAVEFSPDAPVTSLQTPAVLTLHYGASAKAAHVAQASNLHVFRLEGTTWRYVGGRADETTESISAPISQLGVYALFEATGEVTQETLGDLTCTPRVFSPGASQGYSDRTVIGFSVATSDAGNAASIKIYNEAGRLMRELSPVVVPGANSVAWDGLNEDNNVVPSGLYIVAVHIGGIQKTKTVVVLNKYARP